MFGTWWLCLQGLRRADTPAWLSALAAGKGASDGSASGDCHAGAGSGGGGDGSPPLTSKASAQEASGGSGRAPAGCSDSDFSSPELAPVRLPAGCVRPRHAPLIKACLLREAHNE